MEDGTNIEPMIENQLQYDYWLICQMIAEYQNYDLGEFDEIFVRGFLYDTRDKLIKEIYK